jgi:hypothetical protein
MLSRLQDTPPAGKLQELGAARRGFDAIIRPDDGRADDTRQTRAGSGRSIFAARPGGHNRARRSDSEVDGIAGLLDGGPPRTGTPTAAKTHRTTRLTGSQAGPCSNDRAAGRRCRTL